MKGLRGMQYVPLACKVSIAPNGMPLTPIGF